MARETEAFKPIEIQALQEVLDDYHAFNHKHGHVALTFEKDSHILGFAYYAPAAMTDRTWYLYWIAVSRETQAKCIVQRDKIALVMRVRFPDLAPAKRGRPKTPKGKPPITAQEADERRRQHLTDNYEDGR